MLNFLIKHKMEEVAPKDAPPAGETAPPTPPVEPPATPPVAPPANKVEDEKIDEFGYEKTPDPKVVDTPKPKDEPIVEPASGYDKAPPKVADEPPKDDPPPADLKDELKLDTGELLPEEITQIKEFAKKHGVTKEVAQALVDIKKAEIARLKASMSDAQKKAEVERAKIKAGWYEELKTDQTFGGDKFAHNINRVDKVLKDFFPGLKKVLTDGKQMLPPYVMRDMAKLADHLYATDKLVQGDPAKPDKAKEEVDDALAFYN